MVFLKQVDINNKMKTTKQTTKSKLQKQSMYVKEKLQ